MRIEVGPRDVEQGTCVAARRDRPGKEGKQFGIPLDPEGFAGAVQTLLDEVQVCLGFRQSHLTFLGILIRGKAEVVFGLQRSPVLLWETGMEPTLQHYNAECEALPCAALHDYLSPDC